MWALLEFLARYPGAAGDDPPPFGAEAVMVCGAGDPRLVDAIASARRRGAQTRAWLVGGDEIDFDTSTVRVGTTWPL